jgi:hypothetical protein
MATTHTVLQGEYLARIAEKYGFPNYTVIWNHPRNAELKKKRGGNPNVLYPGDKLHIPDKTPKTVKCNTGASYRFRIRATPVTVRFLIRGYNEKPVVNASVVLKIEGQTYKLTTNSKGMVEQEIPSTAETGALIYRNTEIPLKIGHLDPIDTVTGWQARLNNLGYDAGISGDQEDRRLRSALQEFQCDRGLQVDGVCGPETQAKLKQVHGS